MATKAVAAVVAPAAGTASQYAAYRKARNLIGCSRQLIHQKLSDGFLRPAVRPDGLLDFALADKLLASRGVPVIETQPKQGGVVVDGSTFMAAKARREQAEAELAEIKLRKARADLIEAEEGRRAYRAIGAMYSAARENLPTQLAVLLVGKTEIGEIEAILRHEMRASDERVASEIEARYPACVASDENQASEKAESE